MVMVTVMPPLLLAHPPLQYRYQLNPLSTCTTLPAWGPKESTLMTPQYSGTPSSTRCHALRSG